MKQIALLAFIISCAGSCLALSDQQQIENALKQEFLGKTLILRHPMEKNSQQYDQAGTALTHAKEGAWTVYGAFTVKKVALRTDHLEIEGPRVLLTFKQDPDAITSVPGEGTLSVKIRLDKPCDSPEDAVAIAHRVFAITDAELYESVPIFWKAYVKRLSAEKTPREPVAENMHKQSGADKAGSAFAALDGLFPENRPNVSGHSEGAQSADLVALGELGVTPPKAIYTPTPSYAEFAKKHHIQGVMTFDAVIDENGRVVFSQVRQPLGMGLDELTMNALAAWRFQPGKKAGKPVKVLMMLEVQVHLF